MLLDYLARSAFLTSVSCIPALALGIAIFASGTTFTVWHLFAVIATCVVGGVLFALSYFLRGLEEQNEGMEL